MTDSSKPGGSGLFGGSLFGDNSAKGGSLFPTAAAADSNSSSLFPSTNAANASKSAFGGLASADSAAKTGAGSSLFGNVGASNPTSGGLFGKGTGDLFGKSPKPTETTTPLPVTQPSATKPAEPEASKTLFGGAPTAKPGESLFGGGGDSSSSKPLFGGDNSKPTTEASKPSDTAASFGTGLGGGLKTGEDSTAAKPATEATKIGGETVTDTGGLDMTEKIEDVLARWERRLGRQVEEFKKYSRAVSDIDAALFDYVLKLVQVRNEQDDLENKQGELIKSVRKVEAQQRAMMEAIEAMEKKVADRMPKMLPPDPESLEGLANTINKTINEMESQVIDLARSVDQLQVEANPGLGKLMLIVSAHAKALSRASATANSLCSA